MFYKDIKLILIYQKFFPEFFLRILCFGDCPPFLTVKMSYMGGIREGGGGNPQDRGYASI
jgi:hypothetical protein